METKKVFKVRYKRKGFFFIGYIPDYYAASFISNELFYAVWESRQNCIDEIGGSVCRGDKENTFLPEEPVTHEEFLGIK